MIKYRQQKSRQTKPSKAFCSCCFILFIFKVHDECAAVKHLISVGALWKEVNTTLTLTPVATTTEGHVRSVLYTYSIQKKLK